MTKRELQIVLRKAADGAFEKVGAKLAEVQEKTSSLVKTSIAAEEGADGAGARGMREIEGGAFSAAGGPATPRRVPGTPAGSVPSNEIPVGGGSAPRFVFTPTGIIDTASPELRKQIDDVADSMINNGILPTGVRQGGTRGLPGVYQNRSNALPAQPLGYYREVDVWPGPGPRGTQRLIIGGNNEVWYSPDHYATFRRVR
ncbi:ribonuclease domain-containing protein [Frankia tisae]|uniref:ribonuclease domain-containing protein n=1 Tax=Frankia tisae TaxID=2950104 RepID=UPI0021C1D818|nr:ribonuclease domain-containing protein [Frankia tisae]